MGGYTPIYYFWNLVFCLKKPSPVLQSNYKKFSYKAIFRPRDLGSLKRTKTQLEDRFSWHRPFSAQGYNPRGQLIQDLHLKITSTELDWSWKLHQDQLIPSKVVQLFLKDWQTHALPSSAPSVAHAIPAHIHWPACTGALIVSMALPYAWGPALLWKCTFSLLWSWSPHSNLNSRFRLQNIMWARVLSALYKGSKAASI